MPSDADRLRTSRTPIVTSRNIFNHVIAPDPDAVVVSVGFTGCTWTVTERAMLPPGPVQSSVNVALLDSEPVDSLPEIGLSPVQAPDARQLSDSVLVHESVAEPFIATNVEFAENAKVGAIAGV